MNIAQIRAKYPQYRDLSDKQLADALHAKFYSDLPIGDYYKRIGFAPETTFLGQVKETVKGIVPGAIGLVESAATGASALLPEDYEKAAREKIADIAGAAKAPFAAAPGYEETVGRKLGEAVGSTVPFLAAGPLGLVGRIGAVGLGVGAGAGEARTRAEKEGATEEQRSTATALGIIPGAAEIFAPFRILSRIPEGEVLTAVQKVKRVLTAGGEEAAQEAASGLAQNMIAKGVYKPEQELIEGLGEQAAYGGATGAIIQGLMDLALGRRARGAAPAAPPTEAPVASPPALAVEGAEDAERIEPPATGESFEISEFTAPAGPPEGVGAPAPAGVDAAGAPAGAVTTGAPPEPAALTPEPPPVAAPPVAEPPPTPAQTVALKTGEKITIETQSSPEAFSSLVRSQFGEPQALVAKNEAGTEVGRLTFMPGGGPIDVFVREEDRRSGIGSALYDAFESRGGKLPDIESGVAISDEARALRASREKRTQPTPTPAPAPVAVTPAPSPKEIKKEIAEQEKQIGKYYDEERLLSSLEDSNTRELYEASATGVLPESQQLGSRRLGETLRVNNLDANLNELPTDFSAYTPEQKSEYTQKVAQEIYSGLEGTRTKRAELPQWEKLTRDGKDFFLANMTENTPEERARARTQLRTYLNRVSTAQGTPRTETKASPEARIYELNRPQYSKLEEVSFPTWEKLTPEQRELFETSLRQYAPEGKSARTAAVQQDYAFKALGNSIKDAQEAAEGKARAEGKAPASYVAAQKEIAEKQKAESKTEPEAAAPVSAPELGWKSETEAKPIGAIPVLAPKPAEREVPSTMMEAIQSGDTKRVLNVILAGAKNPVHRHVAQRILQLGNGLKTRIEIVDSLPGSRVAEYDPKTDKISVTRQGITNTTLLHEAVHAVTVKALNKYLTGKKLTDAERDAIEQLEAVKKLAEEKLGGAYPEAFENLYEFVSYALSNNNFQNSLVRVKSEKLEYSELPREASLWTDFMRSLSQLFPSVAKLFNKKGEVKPGEANLLAETFNSFEQIMAVPEGGVEMEALPAKETKKAPPEPEQKSDAEYEAQLVGELKPRERGAKSFAKRLWSSAGYEWLAQKFQNQQRVIKRIYDRAERFGIVKRLGDDLNDVWGQLSRSTGMALDLHSIHMEPLSKQVMDGIDAYAKKKNIPMDEALARLHAVFESRHEGERRHIKYLLKVPLDNNTKYTVKGFNNEKGQPLQLSADGWREHILKQLSRADLAPTVTAREAEAKRLRKLLEQIVSTPSMQDALIKAKEPARFDETSTNYNVIGDRPYAEIQQMKRVFDLAEDKAELDAIGDALQKVHKETVKLNKMGNYWSVPVQNIVNFYDYQNYVPFKGRMGKTTIDDEFELDSKKIGGELQDYQQSFEGRKSESENPILQSLAEGAMASMRAGRKDLTLAIKNAINDKILKGNVLENKIKFEDRYIKGQTKEELGGRNRIFHYKEDGTIDVLELEDFTQLEAIRRLFRESSPVLDRMNTLTSAIGQTHTRYNPSFAPMNFVRDSLTNAFIMGSEMGAAKAGRFIKAVSADVATGAPAKALRFAMLYGKGRFDEINRLAGGTAPYESLNETQRYYRDIKEYVKLGGKVSYLQGIAAKGALDKLMAEVGQSGIMKRKAQVDEFFDIYNDIFELSARVSAYRVMKTEFQAQGEEKESAKVHAVEYTKNFANFEQVGEYGKAAGAFFMFFRPAATGAVRAIDALKPAFSAINEAEFTEQAKAEGRTPEQISRALSKMREEQKNARRMSGALLGAGTAMYVAAMLMADDDEEGRNRVATDDPARWTRYARFFIPGYEQPLQIPWGFGPGAFAAAGAQIAAVVTPGSKTTLSDAFGNIALIGLESFLPLPFSRISPIENFPAFLFDSVTPSAARPFFEYVMNLDGLGREIYNNRQSRYGDAYTGGDNIPEMYKSIARTLFDATNGAVDWSPNTMYFFANSFADGFAKIFSNVYNLGMSVTGTKDFDPKNDLFVLSSFIGTKSNVDAREFSKAEDFVKGLEKRLNSLKDKPAALDKFLDANPDAEDLVNYYNRAVNQQLRRLRQDANQVRVDTELTPRERKAEIDQIVSLMNGTKRDILEELKERGYKP